MGEGTAETGQKKREQRVESLGWITESSVMPKKHKAIEGVGASSILELKAQLYRSQQEAKANSSTTDPAAGEYHHARKRVVPLDVSSRKNSGVEARAARDKLELKAVKDGSASYAALERKAELYEKLSRGEVPDEEDKEKYCVDFFQKSLVQSNIEQQGAPDIPTISRDHQEDEDIEADSLFISAKSGPGRTSTLIDRDEHKRFVREVHEEVNQARERASALKQRRQEQEAARREKLKQAYLRKQLEKLKAANGGHS